MVDARLQSGPDMIVPIKVQKIELVEEENQPTHPEVVDRITFFRTFAN